MRWPGSQAVVFCHAIELASVLLYFNMTKFIVDLIVLPSRFLFSIFLPFPMAITTPSTEPVYVRPLPPPCLLPTVDRERLSGSVATPLVPPPNPDSLAVSEITMGGGGGSGGGGARRPSPSPPPPPAVPLVPLLLLLLLLLLSGAIESYLPLFVARSPCPCCCCW